MLVNMLVGFVILLAIIPVLILASTHPLATYMFPVGTYLGFLLAKKRIKNGQNHKAV